MGEGIWCFLPCRLVWTAEARPSRTHCGDLCLVKSKWFRIACSTGVDVLLFLFLFSSALADPKFWHDDPVRRLHLERRVSPLCRDAPCSDQYGMVLFGWFQEHAWTKRKFNPRLFRVVFSSFPLWLNGVIIRNKSSRFVKTYIPDKICFRCILAGPCWPCWYRALVVASIALRYVSLLLSLTTSCFLVVFLLFFVACQEMWIGGCHLSACSPRFAKFL